LTHALGIVVFDAPFGNLAGAPKWWDSGSTLGRIVRSTAGPAIGEGLDFLEFRLLGGGVNQAIPFGVEARGGRKAPVQTREALMTRKQKYR
jgi:hypothetical protein